MTAEILSILMFATTFAFLLFGFPVAFTLAGTAILFAIYASFANFLSADFLALIPSKIFGTMTNELLVAVPLFVFMGLILEKSRIAEELLETIANLFGKIKGGLGFTVIIVGTLLAASTGIVGATVVTMGLLTLPTMIKWKYDKKLASGFKELTVSHNYFKEKFHQILFQQLIYLLELFYLASYLFPYIVFGK